MGSGTLLGCVSAHGTGNLYIWKDTITAERYIQVLEQDMLPCRQCFFQDVPQDNVKPHSAYLQLTWHFFSHKHYVFDYVKIWKITSLQAIVRLTSLDKTSQREGERQIERAKM